jgi:hypothetical protein
LVEVKDRGVGGAAAAHSPVTVEDLGDELPVQALGRYGLGIPGTRV